MNYPPLKKKKKMSLKKTNDKKKRKEQTHQAAWNSSSSSSEEEDDCNVVMECLMTSFDGETSQEVVPLETLSKDELVDIINRASSKLKSCRSRKHKIKEDYAALYDEYYSIAIAYNELEEQLTELKGENSKLIEEVDILKTTNGDLIAKLQNIETQPLITIDDDKVEKLTKENEFLLTKCLCLEANLIHTKDDTEKLTEKCFKP